MDTGSDELVLSSAASSSNIEDVLSAARRTATSRTVGLSVVLLVILALNVLALVSR